MSKRRLNEPVFRAICLCKQTMECVSRADWKAKKAHLGELMAKIHSKISGLCTEFGTLVLEVELQFFNENDLTLRNKQLLEQQLDKIAAFLRKNKTYCAMEYFGPQKRHWATDAYKNLQMNGAETFMHDFQSEWLLIGRVNFYWGDRDKMLIAEASCCAIFGPSDQQSEKDFREEFINKFVGNVLKAMRLIDTPRYNQINGKVAEVKEAANSSNNLQKVREKIKELRRLLKREKRSFEGPYQLLFT
uniref:Uncharacterized protein n=1 Tax=Globodera rostochiensis TaxID=31243 RepID=A0A914HLU1_GLORO